MRAPGMLRALPFALLCAACSFRVVPDPGAASDGRIDGAPGTPLRKLITIDPVKVIGGQVGFPVWIVLDGDADLEAHAAGDGSDIYFTLGDGTPTPFQIQRWTKAAGHLEAWARADLNDLANTVLELRYGDPATARTQSPMQVFSSSFAAVWHLDDPLDTAAVADATGQHAGTPGGLGPSNQVPAQLGGGVDFDGTSQRINFTLPLTGGVDHTISAWVNQRTAAGCDTIVTMGNPNTNESRWFHSHYMTGVSTGFYGNDWPSSNVLPVIDGTGWALLHWTFKNANRQGKVYMNGMQVGSTNTFSSGVNTKGTDGNLGFAPSQWGLCALNGILDEVRIATAERSAGWIATEYANQHDPQTFYAVGAEEPVR